MNQQLEQFYNSLFAKENYDEDAPDIALKHLGSLIDCAFQLKNTAGFDKALRLSNQLLSKDLSSKETALTHYFIANAWSSIRTIDNTEKSDFWEASKREKEIFHLKTAKLCAGFSLLPPIRQAQILTNLANAFDSAGRCVEAIEFWDQALEILPDFHMALGNKGIGLVAYAGGLKNSSEKYFFIIAAQELLNRSCLADEKVVDKEAIKIFKDIKP